MKPFSFLTLLYLLQVSFVEIMFIRAYRTIHERTSENYDSACKQFVYTLQRSGYIYNDKITNDNRISIIDFISSEIYLVNRYKFFSSKSCPFISLCARSCTSTQIDFYLKMTTAI